MTTLCKESTDVATRAFRKRPDESVRLQRENISSIPERQIQKIEIKLIARTKTNTCTH